MFVSIKQRTLGAVAVAVVSVGAGYAHAFAPVGPPVTDTKPIQPMKPSDLRVDPKITKPPLNLVIGTVIDFPPANGKGKATKEVERSSSNDLTKSDPLTVHWTSPQLKNPANKPVLLAWQIVSESVSPDAGTSAIRPFILGSGTVSPQMDGSSSGTFVLDSSVWSKVNWADADKENKGSYAYAKIYLRITPMVNGTTAASTSNAALIKLDYQIIN